MSLIAIISDIHGNIDALEAVLEDIDQQNADIVACLGDIVGYGGAPKECVERIKRLCFPVLMGNHEVYAALPLDPDEFSPAVARGIECAREQLSEDQLKWLRELPMVIDMGEATIAHASLDEPAEFKHIVETEEAQAHFELQETPICFIGHTHVPTIMEETASGVERYDPPEEFMSLDLYFNYAVNVGSVGQPRDGDPRACYVLYDTERAAIRYRRISYDIDRAQNRFKKAGIHEEAVKRLARGE
jgi:predicted phosphodiesterase